MSSSITQTLNGIVGAGKPVVSVAPVALSAPGRAVPLGVRVSAPATGTGLPVILFSHGKDWSKLSSRGPDWFTDAYKLSLGATSLLTLFDAEHSLGGIPGYEVAETTDDSPERVAVLQRLTTAYLRSALDPADTSWAAASSALNESADPIGRVDNKQHHSYAPAPCTPTGEKPGPPRTFGDSSGAERCRTHKGSTRNESRVGLDSRRSRENRHDGRLPRRTLSRRRSDPWHDDLGLVSTSRW
ncbi:hypothetical protein [Streptomyces sp. NPDC056669]|uniref:hypothetical protein n=1 Tax=Streptomyces sp. NPDC056669 TaxID=3345903 RepID=UPI00367D4CC8